MRTRPPHAPNSFYHVTLRGNRQQPIFYDRHDRYRWEQLLTHAMSRYGSRLHLYCWMTNHVHMVLECGSIPIFKTLHLAAGAYARAFNARYAHVGHLFQDRYGSQLVETDEYLLQLIRYIHYNPVTAEIVENPFAYRWSSCRAYASADEPPWLTTEFVLAMFSPYRSAARAQMQAFTRDAETDIVRSFELPPLPAPIPPPKPPVVQPELDEVIKEASDRFTIDESILHDSSRQRRVSKARAWIAWAAQGNGVATLADVARRLNRQPSVLSRSIARYQLEFDQWSSR